MNPPQQRLSTISSIISLCNYVVPVISRTSRAPNTSTSCYRIDDHALRVRSVKATPTVITMLLTQQAGLGLILTTFAIAAMPAPYSRRSLEYPHCATGVQIIAARGTDQAPGLGSMAGVVEEIMNTIPGSQAVGLAYPASMLPTYRDSESAGARNMTVYIKYFAEKCPDTKLVLLGYSQVSYRPSRIVYCTVLRDVSGRASYDGRGLWN